MDTFFFVVLSLIDQNSKGFFAIWQFAIKFNFAVRYSNNIDYW